MVAYTQFNPYDKDAGQVINAGLGWQTSNPGACRVYDGQSTGKYYFEIIRTISSFDYNVGAGLVTHGATYADMGTGNNGFQFGEYGPGNQLILNGTIQWQNALANENQNMGFAIDLTDGVFWVSQDVTQATPVWNNGAGTPYAGTGGLSFGVLIGQKLYPFVVSTSNNNYTFTGKFGGSTFLIAATTGVPSGYTPGWPGVGISPTTQQWMNG